MIKGIDISKWQGQPDFTKIRDSDIKFVIVKASEGYGYRDDQLTRNQKECREKGILLGYYAYVRPDLKNNAEDEADYFLRQIGMLQPGEFLALDFEVGYDNKVVWCKKWLDRVYEKTGVKPLIYLNKSLVANNNWQSVIDAGYGLWLADYTYDINSQAPEVSWPFIAMRQYSNKGAVEGIYGAVDMNVFYGSLDSLKKYGYKDSTSTPEDPEDPVGCFKLSDNIPTEVEDLYNLKGKYWYDKYWTFDEFIKYSIALNDDEVAYRAFLHYVNSKITGTKPVDPNVLEKEQEELQYNVDILLQKLQANITKDITVFTDQEIRKEFFSRKLDKISKFLQGIYDKLGL